MSRDEQAVTVVIPAYNAGRDLGAALASVAGQVLAPAEIVIVDDGSTDDTRAVACRWAELLPIRIVEHATQQGPGRCRNSGVEHARSPLLAFLDADDVWFPNHLRTCVSLQARHGGVVAGRGYRWSEDRGVIPGQEDRTVGPPPDAPLEWILRHHSFGIHSVLRRDLFEEVGGFDTSMEGAEDWDLWLRIAATGAPMRRTTTRTFLYRQHDANLSLQVDRVADAGLRVLDRFTREHAPLPPNLARAVRDSQALIAYNRASARLGEGRFAEARRAAAPALRGPARLRLVAAMMTVAPASTGRLRARRGGR